MDDKDIIALSVPELGIDNALQVGMWYVQVGAEVPGDTLLLELETERAIFEVTAPRAARLVERRVKTGAEVAAGAVLAVLEPCSEPPPGPVPELRAPRVQEDSRYHALRTTAAARPAESDTVTRIPIVVPALGESVEEAMLGERLVEVGDWVEADQSLLILETDKVSVELPSPATGEVVAWNVEPDEDVVPGQEIGWLSFGAPVDQESLTSAEHLWPELARIREHPDDLLARRRLARRLSRANDPRGSWLELWNRADGGESTEGAIEGMRNTYSARWWTYLHRIGARCRWRAGFVFGVQLDAATCFEHQAAIAEHTPFVDTLSLTDCEGLSRDAWRTLFHAWGSKLRGLELAGNIDVALEVLATSDVLNLRELSLKGPTFSATFLALVHAGRLDTVEVLTCTSEHLADEAMLAWFERAPLASLRALHLEGTGLSERTLHALALTPCPALERVVVDRQAFTARTHLRLAQSTALPSLVDVGINPRRIEWQALVKDHPELAQKSVT